MFDISKLSDSADDLLGQANDLIDQGAKAYKTVTGVTKPPQTAKDVAAAAPVKQPFNWKPVAIGAAIVGGLLAIWYALKGK